MSCTSSSLATTSSIVGNDLILPRITDHCWQRINGTSHPLLVEIVRVYLGDKSTGDDGIDDLVEIEVIESPTLPNKKRNYYFSLGEFLRQYEPLSGLIKCVCTRCESVRTAPRWDGNK